MIAALANIAWLATSTPVYFQFLRALQHPEQTQRAKLARLIRSNAESAYGRAHHFGEIRNYAQFAECVPIVNYEDIDSWIVRIMRGEKSLLTAEPVTRLVPTGGSSGGRKLIPYTASSQRELNAAIGPWMVDLCRRHPTISGGPAYWSISPAIPNLSEQSAVPIGFDDDSAYLGGIARRLTESTFAVPSALRDIPDAETSRYVTLLCLLRARELRLVSVWHPSFLTLMLDTLASEWDELLHDIENGGCRLSSSLPASVAAAIAKPGDAHRARELRDCDPSEVHTIWPRWKVLSCWGDAQATLPLESLRIRVPGVFAQRKGLLATESFVTIPFRDAHPLALTSHFFEFQDSRGTIRLAHELRRDEQYTVIVTTSGGLWRYRIGDIVEVDGFVGATPSLRFLGRGSSTSDLCGEKLTEVFVSQAIAATCAALRFSPSFAMLAPEGATDGRWHYTLFHDGTSPAGLSDHLDAELGTNPHYAHCQNLGQLGPLRCRQVGQGAHERFVEFCSRGGRRAGDVKPQALSTRTDWRQIFGE